jgi:2-oxoglutarate dehydrogenase E2 component (dihydrolipoamide succinyltransferase)
MEAITMIFPELDKDTQEAEISYWYKKNGDTVQKGETLCEVETEEFAFELSASDAGVLTIIAKNGTKIKVGDAICEILPNEILFDDQIPTAV